jgi:cytochrome c-type biogenesis protein
MLDISIAGALIAGVLSFLSPCILPIVPFYISYMAGVSAGQIADGAPITKSVRFRALLTSLMFSAGVITIFMALGAAASTLGQMVREWFDILRWIAAAIIIAMGLHFIGLIRINLLYRQFRADVGETSNISLVGAYVIGLAFAFGWTPCVGPVLAAILFTAAGAESAGRGAALLFIYGMGMTMPFVLAALFIGPFLKLMQHIRKYLGHVEKAMGVMLILFGLLIATDTVRYIAEWMLNATPIFEAIG